MKTTALLLLLSASLFGQIDPEGAHVFLYFPQLADGGVPAGRWQTSFVFLNPHSTLTANLRLSLFNDSGQPLSMNFGSGSNNVHDITIPPNGTRIIRSAGNSPTTVVGWAVAVATIPVQGTVLFRQIDNGQPKVELSAPATLPSGGYFSPANRDLGIALGNIYGVSRNYILGAFNSNGTLAGNRSITLGPLGHTSFNLWQQIPGLPTNFEGSIQISSEFGADQFVAWTLNSDRGLLSTLPTGRLAWPISHSDRIWLVYQKLIAAAPTVLSGFNVTLPFITLNVNYDREINAYARPPATIQINIALSELISDSPSELAFAVAHEIAHVAQFRRGGSLILANREQDADVVGMMMMLMAGFDPYAGAGTLAKLSMASGHAGVLAQFFDDLTDPHGSFGTRIDTMAQALSLTCAQPVAAPACALYRETIHPHFPPTAPLSITDGMVLTPPPPREVH